MAVDVVVFGTTAPSSGCGCCSTACCDPEQSMEKEVTRNCFLLIPQHYMTSAPY
jgi:hypothetical protein